MSVVGQWQGETAFALRTALSLTAKEFAAALGIEERSVRRWERKDSAVRIRVRNQRRLTELLDNAAPPARHRFFQGLCHRSDSVDEPATADRDATTLTIDATGVEDPDQVRVLARAADGKAVLVSLSRRALVAGLGAGALAATVGAQPTPVPAAQAGTDWVTHLGELRLSLIDHDNMVGGAKVLPLVEHNVEVIGRLRRTDVADTTALQRMRVLYAEYASWLHQDARAWDHATAWIERANRWALTLHDPGCVSMVSIRRAHIACERGDGVEALEYAEAATVQAPRGSRLAAVAAVYGGWGHALLHDATASAHAFDQARTLAATADDDSEWGMFLDNSYVEVHQATAAGSLGRHRSAIDEFATAIAGMRGNFTRDKAVYTARLALAHAHTGEHAAAAALATAAMHTGVATGSQRVLAPVRQLRTMIDPASTDPHISEFAAAAEVWLGQPA